MKYNFSTFLLLVSFVFVFASCKKDDDGKSNEMQVDDVNIAIGSGSLFGYGTGSYHDGFNLDLRLFQEGFTVVDLGNHDYEYQGNGFVIYCEMFSETETALSEGIYSFNDTSDVYPVRTFDDLSYKFDYEDGQWYDCVEGSTVEVRKSGSNYEITIDAIDENGDVVKGFYSGPLTFIDMDYY